MEKTPMGIYIHIPFCRQKCGYCDFASYVADSSVWDAYIEKLISEIRFRSQFLSLQEKQIDTIFFGGGTPTLLGPKRLGLILSEIQNQFCLDSFPEITLEANPETVQLKEWQEYKQRGWTRASIGVQSFNDTELKACGRIHNSNQAKKAIVEAKAAGFNHINLDLIYGLPQQTLYSFQETMKKVLNLPIDHLSVYGLQLEEGTAFYEMERKGNLPLPEPEEEEAMYDWLQSFLFKEKWERYEVSNFSRPGGQCRHNLKYWQYRPYLGFGAGACGFDGQGRLENQETIEEYFIQVDSWIKEKSKPVNTEKLSDSQRQAEFCFMGLRTKEGLSAGRFQKLFGESLENIYLEALEQAIAAGWIQEAQGRYFPTEKGFRFNNLLGELFLKN